jgi:hypothetical protein
MEKLVVSALLEDFTILDDEDQIRIHDSRKTMGHDERRSSACESPKAS